ncbi:hypothetical protein ACQ4LE_007094 [Meloidogyne hapla]|uniref:Alpha-amylase n=1 Tax=Meloidogyne hapla TaxID=6305 RepID=A0A1I8BB56_MELHA
MIKVLHENKFQRIRNLPELSVLYGDLNVLWTEASSIPALFSLQQQDFKANYNRLVAEWTDERVSNPLNNFDSMRTAVDRQLGILLRLLSLVHDSRQLILDNIGSHYFPPAAYYLHERLGFLGKYVDN